MKSKKKPKNGIIGIGTVGRVVKYWFEKEKYPLFLYDKYKKIGSLQEINKAEVIFICVPTPFHEEGAGYDDTAVIESLKILSGSKIVVIKSTILPGSTERFQREFPKHKILFNPEFLRHKTALKDFLHPNRQIIGYTIKSKRVAKKILNILPKAPYQRIIPSKEAEMAKYFGNCFLAMRVIFAEQIYDLCQALNIDYNLVKEVASRDPRIGQSHLNVFPRGLRGYNGPCLPKDVKTLIQFARSFKVNLSLLEVVDKLNENLRKKSIQK
jgi:UDPglucose 6-dehydrogenase